MAALPTGNITYLFTDVEGSSRLWEQSPESMRAALIRHDAIVIEAVEREGGVVVRSRGEGDSMFAVFSDAERAVTAACALQRALHNEPWPAETPIRVRAALHSGVADLRDGSYYGNVVNRCARLRSLAHAGQTLVSSVTCELVSHQLTGGISLESLGNHRLKDLQRPEHVFQLSHPDLPSAFPALRSLGSFCHNLPVVPTSFIGRERALAEVRQLLKTERLVTIHGPGGAGKTRFALQIAAEAVDEFESGVWFVELDAVSHPALVLQTIATALGVSEEPGQALTETLSFFLRAKSSLLILDNCEHVVEMAAQITDRLLRACPGVRILATSQCSLGVSGERLYTLPRLGLPRATGLTGTLPSTEDELERYEATRLFIERARQLGALPTLNPDQARQVARICERLDGIPLAIELAAPWTRVLTLDQIAERLDDSLRLLSRGSRTAPGRQQTLLGTVSWSHGLLTERERALLHRLSVFAGGWTLEAAQAVCATQPGDEGPQFDEWDVVDLLLALVDHSLVAVEESESGEKRYRLLETVRQYSEGWMAQTGEGPRLRERHRDYFLQFAENAAPKVRGPEQKQWLDRLDSDHDNLRAALNWCHEDPAGAESELRVAAALWWFWYTRGYLSEGRRRLEEALLRREKATEACTANALTAAGSLCWALGRHDDAERYHRECLRIRERSGDRSGAAAALNNIGLVARSRGNLAQSHELVAASVEIYRSLGDSGELARSLGNLGSVSDSLGDLTGAAQCHSEALAIYERLGDTVNIATCLHNLSHVLLSRNNLAEALRLLVQSMSIREKIDDWPGLASALHSAGLIAVASADYERAARLLAGAEALCRSIGFAWAKLDQASRDAAMVLLKQQLGADRFARAWASGMQLPRSELIELARSEVTSDSPPSAEHAGEALARV